MCPQDGISDRFRGSPVQHWRSLELSELSCFLSGTGLPTSNKTFHILSRWWLQTEAYESLCKKKVCIGSFLEKIGAKTAFWSHDPTDRFLSKYYPIRSHRKKSEVIPSLWTGVTSILGGFWAETQQIPLCNLQWRNADRDSKIDETPTKIDRFTPDFFLWLSIHKYLQENRSVGSWDQNAVLAPIFSKKVPIQTFFLQRLSYPPRQFFENLSTVFSVTLTNRD
jgi:hypothetical protein